MIYLLFICVSARVYVSTHGGQRASDPWRLELQASVSCLTWVLRTELWSSVKKQVL